MLCREPDVTSYRQVFILAGSNIWQKTSLAKILRGYETDSLWVTNQERGKMLSGIPFITSKKVHTWLGNEKRVVVFDANSDFDPDSFAAISGIVVGGGFFFLLLPEKEQWNKVYSSPFGQRFIKSINVNPELIIVKQNEEIANFLASKLKTKSSEKISAPFLTSDQQHIVEKTEEQVLNEKTNPVVIISDRGRGKSAALGILAARILKSGIQKIVITAPRLRATDIVFKHISALLPEAEVTRGCVKTGNGIIQFHSPDQLIQDNIAADLLLVDEAAAIPVPILTSFLCNYPQCIFATTVHGYEGTGRGFALRFYKALDEKKSGWLKLTMETPIRWPVNDPLENWMFSLLCLDAEIAEFESSKPDLSKLENSLLMKEELAENQVLLNEVFSLLVAAHYRTRPNDLKSFLDDDNISLYITLYNKHVVAVALIIHEGSFNDLLSTKVYRGERRPRGHLLAQALSYHCGVEFAATLDYARVMRIAVHPELQGQGIGSRLLDFIITNEKNNGRDAIGTSFGVNKKLLNFWQQADFNIMRIGFTREQTSGEHAAIMLLAFTSKGKKIKDEAGTRFNKQLPFWLGDVLRDINSEIVESIKIDKVEGSESIDLDKKDLQSFKKYSRNYELCIAAINHLVIMKKNEIEEEEFPGDFRDILVTKVVNKKSWKEVGLIMKLAGQNEARKLFYRAVCYLME